MRICGLAFVVRESDGLLPWEALCVDPRARLRGGALPGVAVAAGGGWETFEATPGEPRDRWRFLGRRMPLEALPPAARRVVEVYAREMAAALPVVEPMGVAL